jgi:glycosyltransferase involved in cell wall biosynthesis
MGTHMLDLVAEFSAQAAVTVMAWPTPPGRRLLERAVALGADAVPLPHPRDRGFAEAVTAQLRTHAADVFHVHVGTGREDFDGARAARRAGVGVVVQTLHQPWLLGSRKHRVPFFHALEEVDHLLTVSEAQRRTYERIGVPPELMTTVPNGARPRGPGPGREAARAALGLDPRQRVVLTVGRLAVMKGQGALVAAVPALADRFPDVGVVLLGSGHLHEELRAQADRLGVGDRVHLPGHRADARALLDAADVFVLPSRYEGMPLALLEAMDAGLPVVTTRAPGCTEVVADGVTGLLVPPEDPPALAAALARLLEDPALRQRMGRAGRLRYLECFTSAGTASRTVAVYERELARARTAPTVLAGGMATHGATHGVAR